MQTLAEALVAAMSYLKMPSDGGARDDDDIRALEAIGALILNGSDEEQAQLINAANQAGWTTFRDDVGLPDH